MIKLILAFLQQNITMNHDFHNIFTELISLLKFIRKNDYLGPATVAFICESDSGLGNPGKERPLTKVALFLSIFWEI